MQIFHHAMLSYQIKENYNISGATSALAGFQMRVQLYIPVELNFGDVGIFGGRKTEEPGEIPRSKSRTNSKLNPYGNEPKSNLSLIGGRRALSRLPTISYL